MNVKILSGTVAKRKKREPGEVVTGLSEAEAHLLVNIGKAEMFKPENREDDLGGKISTKEAVETMTALGDDKDAIEAYALKHFAVDLNKSFKPENMIEEFKKKTTEND